MNKLKNFISLRIYLLLVFGLVGAAGCLGITYFVSSAVGQQLSLKVDTKLEEYSYMVANHVEITGYMNSMNTDVEQELLTLAQLYGGRVLLTNRRHVILYDSSGIDNGKLLASKLVARCLEGKTVYELNESNGYAKVLLPLVTTGSKVPIGSLILYFSEAKKMDTLKSWRERAFIVGCVLGIVWLGFCMLAAYLLTLPLVRIRRACAELSGRDLLEPILVSGNRDVAVLGGSINGVLTKINQMEQNRQEFVSAVAHELKTPMASIKVLSDALLQEESAPEALYREFLTDINAEIDRENAIVSDLLTLNTLERSKWTLQPAKVNVNELVESILRRVRPMAEKRGIELVLESYRTVVLSADEVRLGMAITNIIENGIKYNKELGYVHVTLNADLKFLYITVEDSGIGIPEEEQSLVFERFYRVDKARSRETGGSGLGLSIAKEIIQLHQGTIRLQSQVGEGTTITVRIPLRGKL